MRRLFAEPARCKGSEIELDEDESRHAAQVLRARPGDRFDVLNGAGNIFECEALRIEKRAVTLRVINTKKFAPPARIELFQSIAKGKVMDWIVQKATELGASKIVPVLTERTIVEIDSDSGKVEKWRAIAIESIKQCGSPFLPQIEPPVDFKTALKALTGLPLVAALHPSAGEVDEFFGQPISPVQVWIGPEGDFTPAELQALVDAGARPITLGQNVLRCDTAAVASIALAQFHLRKVAV